MSRQFCICVGGKERRAGDEDAAGERAIERGGQAILTSRLGLLPVPENLQMADRIAPARLVRRVGVNAVAVGVQEVVC